MMALQIKLGEAFLPFVSQLLTENFIEYLKKGYFPNHFKLAKLAPIHKAGSRRDCEKYLSPLRLLPFLAKT